MAVAKKYKRKTIKEKEWDKQFRNEMREKGFLPPVKPRLNRNKFAKEVMAEIKEFKFFTDMEYLVHAFSTMLPSDFEIEKRGKITEEHVAILKLIKIAIDVKKYKQDLVGQGIKTYKPFEMYDQVIKPIKNL